MAAVEEQIQWKWRADQQQKRLVPLVMVEVAVEEAVEEYNMNRELVPEVMAEAEVQTQWMKLALEVAVEE